jgi:hypothetical protein
MRPETGGASIASCGGEALSDAVIRKIVSNAGRIENCYQVRAYGSSARHVTAAEPSMHAVGPANTLVDS